jgi:hypothetical protein
MRVNHAVRSEKIQELETKKIKIKHKATRIDGVKVIVQETIIVDGTGKEHIDKHHHHRHYHQNMMVK